MKYIKRVSKGSRILKHFIAKHVIYFAYHKNYSGYACCTFEGRLKHYRRSHIGQWPVASELDEAWLYKVSIQNAGRRFYSCC